MFNICRVSFIYLMMMSIILLMLSFFFIMKDLVYLIEWELFMYNSVEMLMTILLDWMSLMFMSFVLFISSLVKFFMENFYMCGDCNLNRFILLVLMSVLSMMFMIISPNLVSIVLGWDGLGLVSYCLVIYYQNVKSFNAGMLTGSWNYIFYLKYMMNSNEMMIIMSLLMVSAMTKELKFPFHLGCPQQ